MYTRDEAKAIVDKVLNMAKADAVEVDLTGGERSGTRWANSTITTNLIQYDRELTTTVRVGQKQGSANTRDFSDAGIKKMIDDALDAAQKANENERLPELLGPQDYIPVDGASPDMINFGPAERARMVKDSVEIAEKKGVLGAGYIPKIDQTTCNANSKGLFAYYRNADAGFILTCRMPDGTGSGWSGTMGIRDIRMIDAKALTTVAADKALRSRNAKALEPGRYTVILEPRANARFLSLMTGIFNPNGGRGGGGGSGGGGGAAAGDPPDAPAQAGASAGGAALASEEEACRKSRVASNAYDASFKIGSWKAVPHNRDAEAAVVDSSARTHQGRRRRTWPTRSWATSSSATCSP